MKIAFGILSSHISAAAVQQLIDALGPGHFIVIHHDFSKQPDFSVSGEGVHVIRDPVPTAWGDWSLVEATRRLMRIAMEDENIDYFQLLSDTCLPIRPVTEFADFLKTKKPDACIEFVPLEEKFPHALWTHGFRFLAPRDTIFFRILRKTRTWIIGNHPTSGFQHAGIFFPEICDRRRHVVRRKLGQMIHRLAYRLPGAPHPFSKRLQCYVGSQWIGCCRRVCEYLLSMDDTHPIVGFFKTIYGADEGFFHTLIGNGTFDHIAPINHFMLWKPWQSGPLELSEANEAAMIASGKFFARKFPKDPNHPMRLKIIRRVGSI
ncbi:MAG TPA: beta-1,6-N-acetylglucosaminyltransferase [Methylococcus sp.]|nr:beta-1,6-N-acetylglucosaminyltransferase [Methylococcus sp.]